jgi:hypothetical protein
LRLDGTTLDPLIRQLYDELSAHGLVFHPPCHIGDEWFVPIGIPAIFAHIEQTCKRIYRLLTIDGYARIDLRLTAANEVYFIEANPKSHSGGGRGLRAFGGQSGPALSAVDRPDHPARDQNGSRLIGDRLREHAETR